MQIGMRADMNEALFLGIVRLFQLISRSGARRSRHHVDDAIIIVAEVAQKGRQHGRGLRFGSWNRMIPLRAILSRSVRSFNSCSGVIGFQSLAQRSAPNTTMPRDCSRSSVAGVISKPGKRKNGVLGVVVATP